MSGITNNSTKCHVEIQFHINPRQSHAYTESGVVKGLDFHVKERNRFEQSKKRQKSFVGQGTLSIYVAYPLILKMLNSVQGKSCSSSDGNR